MFKIKKKSVQQLTKKLASMRLAERTDARVKHLKGNIRLKEK